MNFREAETYLLSLGNEVAAMRLGLTSIRKLLDALGNPQNNYFKVQVAGTNGKGSVCAFLDAICREALIEVGVFTSPHLVSMTERIRINDGDIPDEEYARIATNVRDAAETLVSKGELDNVPTYFEQVTATALVAFAEANVKLAILETGLGGRHDATTAANADIAAITQIDLDHQEYLGDTIGEIAAEKAAIIRADSIVVVGEQGREAGRVIAEHCKSLDVKPGYSDFVSVREDETGLILGTDLGEYAIGELGLAGRHQIDNAKVALLIAEALSRHFNILKSDMILGLRNARHPGRLEYVGGFLLDGAHNEAGARALRDYLEEKPMRPLVLIFGAMRDKNVAEIAKILFPMADAVILTKPANSRAMTVSEIMETLPATFDRGSILEAADIADAIALAMVNYERWETLISGSLYLVGEARALLLSKNEFEN